MTHAPSALSVEVISLNVEDRAAESELRKDFAKFWSEAQGEPRDIYDRFIGACPMVGDVTPAELDGAGPRGWWLRPAGAKPGRAVLFLHGGAYIQGRSGAYRGFASQIAARAKVDTLAIDYPLAPESPLPGAPEAALAAYTWLAAQGFKKIAVVGDSAGGGLSLVTLSLIAADGTLPRPVAGAVFSPWTDLSLSGASMTDPAVVEPLLSHEMLADAAKAYCGSATRDPLASPLFGTFSGLPPLLIQVGTDEILLDDSPRYAEAAAEAGTKVRLEIWEGMHHVFQLNVEQLASARQALDRAGEFLNDAFGA